MREKPPNDPDETSEMDETGKHDDEVDLFPVGKNSFEDEDKQLFEEVMRTIISWPSVRRVILILKVFGERSCEFLNEEDWEFLVSASKHSREELQEEIQRQCRDNPGRVNQPLSSVFIAEITGLSRSNVDQIFSRAKRRVRCLE